MNRDIDFGALHAYEVEEGTESVEAALAKRVTNDSRSTRKRSHFG